MFILVLIGNNHHIGTENKPIYESILMIEIEYITNKKIDRKKYRKIILSNQIILDHSAISKTKRNDFKRFLKKMFKFLNLRV